MVIKTVGKQFLFELFKPSEQKNFFFTYSVEIK